MGAFNYSRGGDMADTRAKDRLRRGIAAVAIVLLLASIVIAGVRTFREADLQFFLMRWPYGLLVVGVLPFVALRTLFWKRNPMSLLKRWALRRRFPD